MRILNKLWEAMADPSGVTAHRAGGFERIGWILDDWEAAKANQIDVEQAMTEALDQLGLTGLATSIHGLSPVGAAAILAETGDLTRFTSARAIVKLAGLAPRERLSGTFAGKARLSGAGRPGLRTAAWRAVWGCLHANDVYAARYRHLTGREHNKLKPTQAQTVLAAALLRQLWAVITTGQAWDPAIAANGLAHLEEAHVA
jgi:transposase